MDDLAGSETGRALDATVPRWIAADWPFRPPRYLDRDIRLDHYAVGMNDPAGNEFHIS